MSGLLARGGKIIVKGKKPMPSDYGQDCCCAASAPGDLCATDCESCTIPSFTASMTDIQFGDDEASDPLPCPGGYPTCPPVDVSQTISRVAGECKWLWTGDVLLCADKDIHLTQIRLEMECSGFGGTVDGDEWKMLFQFTRGINTVQTVVAALVIGPCPTKGEWYFVSTFENGNYTLCSFHDATLAA